MNEALARQLALLPDYLGHHLFLTVLAMAAGIALSLPLSLLVVRIPRLNRPVLAAVSVIQTVPSLALLALMVPLLGRIGTVPALIALILYSMLPIVRNTVTGLNGTSPEVMEAALGIGMTPTQILLKVQLPLAWPVIIAGIRTATVWVVGTATLSTPVGATSLGNFIFSGLQTQNYWAVLVGCLAAAVLAILLDGLIRLVEIATVEKRRSAAFASVPLLLIAIGAGLWPFLADLARPDHPVVRIGAKTFTEQYILVEVISSRLRATGFEPEVISGLGSTVVFDALAAERIDCYVDYSGTIWANHMRETRSPGHAVVLEEMTRWLRQHFGIRCLGSLGFENAYALALRSETTKRLQIRTLEDLAIHSRGMAIAGDYEFFSRPEWIDLQRIYGLDFQRKVSLDSSLMYEAVRSGEVDVITAFSTDGRIAAFDLTVLEDSRSALPPYDAVLLISRGGAQVPGLTEALGSLIGSISNEAMRKANMAVNEQGLTVVEAARTLSEKP